MSNINAMSQAVTGIKETTKRTDQVADRISKLGQPGSDDRLPEDVVTLKTSQAVIAANAAVIKNVKEMEETLLDILA